MKIPFVDLHRQYLSIKSDIDKAIAGVIAETAFIGGYYVQKFEHNFSKVYDSASCVGVANGTDAIYIVLKMLGIGPGDEVITVANSWISTSETIGQTGATPVFVDIEPEYYSIDHRLIESKINSKTKAVIPVHLYGHPADLDPILALCKKYNLALIEDCAQAHLSEYKGKKVGLFGDASTFSFYPGKNLGAYGDAGAILTDRSDLAEKCRMYANHGALVKHNHQIEGINSRLDGLHAAILDAKLQYLAKWTQHRRNVANIYFELLEDVEEIILPREASYAKHSYHLFVVRSEFRDSLQKYLNDNGIGTAIHYPTPIPLQPAYNHLGYMSSDIPVASRFANQILSLPMGDTFEYEQIKYVCDTIKSFFVER